MLKKGFLNSVPKVRERFRRDCCDFKSALSCQTLGTMLFLDPRNSKVVFGINSVFSGNRYGPFSESSFLHGAQWAPLVALGRCTSGKMTPTFQQRHSLCLRDMEGVVLRMRPRDTHTSMYIWPRAKTTS